MPRDSALARRKLTNIEVDKAIIAKIGLDNPPIAIPMKISASDTLSKFESRNAPLVVVFFITRATLPSTISKKPEINSMILAITCQGNSQPCWFKKFESPKKMLDRIANVNPIILQKVGDRPSEPKLFPIRVVIGAIFSLNLLSKYHAIIHSLTNNLCYPNGVQLLKL